MHKVTIKEIDLNGTNLKLETGKLAQQADASVVATWGETVVLATVSAQPIKEDPGYFPLSVEYVEKYYAGGRITAQKFIKRETRPSDKAVLSGRAIDRSIRPFFPKDFQYEVQIIVTVLSFDGINDPAILGLIATSAALTISSVPWNGPLGVAKVGIKNEEIVINPTLPEAESLSLELLVASTKEKIAMVEAEAKQIADEVVLEAIKKGHSESQKIINLIEDFTKDSVKEKKAFTILADQLDEKLFKEVKKEAKELIEAALFDKTTAWHDATGEQIKNSLAEKYAESLTSVQVGVIFDKVAKEIMNDTILNKGKRVDGRAMDEVREIYAETDILPRTHGSAIFQRGDTQVLSVVTLGPLSAAQTLEGMEGESQKRFMHHYNMSINPFASGEVKKIGAPNRRDVGHGDLVERSILPVLPSDEAFPYAIRVVSEVLASNASTSQAAVCATTLALLNAGVPIEPVAGIALGLLSNEGKFQVITDMRAVEDFYGEMDFKVAGTINGITGIQMDTKLQGISFEIVEEALKQGSAAREMMIAKIKEVAPKEEEISEFAPKIEVTHIKPEEIGLLIGSGGKTINGIIAQTGAQVDIEDDGTVMVSSANGEAIKKAMNIIQNMFRKIEPGEEYVGKVVKITTFGAFVELIPGKEGLVHVSQMAPYRVERPEDVVSEGQTVKVRVIDVDPMGKIALSMLFGEDAARKENHRREGRGGGFRRNFSHRSVGNRGFNNFGRNRNRRGGGGYSR
ncbi:polyribonucleotide nucleotidyltransferase [Candidatus Daviesbacteria bacterium]|nr:polyribonucleotide nucleotidyltransferase [Candidatus Daviesbacteria bacterium]